MSFEFWINGELSKIGHHFSIKVIWKLILSKNVNNKRYAPKLVLFIEKRLRKIRMIFDIENWLWKSNFGLCHLPLIQNSKFNHFLLVCWFLGKSLSNFVSPVWKLHNPYCHNNPDPAEYFQIKWGQACKMGFICPYWLK